MASTSLPIRKARQRPGRGARRAWHDSAAFHAHTRGRASAVPPRRDHRPGPHRRDRHDGRAACTGRLRAGKPRGPLPEAHRWTGIEGAHRAAAGAQAVTRSAIWTILSAELLALRHRLLKRKPARLAALALFLTAAGVFIGAGAFTVGATAGQFLPAARDSMLAGGFTALSVLMLVIGFPTVIATFFVGRDLLQLVLAPVRPFEIFAARLLLAMSANLLISLILLMAALGVGVGSHAPAIYFPLAVILVFLQVLLATAFQVILMSIVLRWVPARRARDVAAAVAGLAGAGFYLAWNLSLRLSFSSRGRPDLSNLTSLVNHIEWLPSAWPGHALSAVIAGNPGVAATWMALSLALAAMVLAAAVVLYERTLLTGLGVFGGGQAVWRRDAARPAAFVVTGSRGAGSP